MSGTNTGTASISSNSTDIAGTFTVNITDATTAGGALFEITFNQAYSRAPIVIITPANLYGSIRFSGFQMWVNSSTTGFTMHANQFADNSNSMKFNYMVIESK